MKSILIIISLVTIAMAPLSTRAQQNYGYLAWDYNAPLTNKNWLDSSTPHGGAIGYRFFVQDEKISVGVDLNWTTFDQYEPTETFQIENGAITTDYYKYIYQYGAVASAQYYFPRGDQEIFFPYAGVGLGANYNDFALYYNIYEESDHAIGFLVRPEAGVLVKFGKYRSLGAIAAVHYDYSTVKYPEYNYSGFSSYGIKIGLVFMSPN